MKILIGVLVFSVMVLIHELGHFLLAKAVGVGVTEFSLGMGPRLLSFVRGETRYSVKLIPFGGSCAMIGEDEENPAENAFNNKPARARFLVIAAGPAFNLVLAFLAAMVMTATGGMNMPVVYRVNAAAGETGEIEPGDVLLSVDGKKIGIGKELQLYELGGNPAYSPIEVEVLREGEKKSFSLDTYHKGYRIGISYYASTDPALLIAVGSGSPAEAAGLKTGDTVLSVDGTEIADGNALSEYLTANPVNDTPLSLVVLRDGQKTECTLVPEAYEEYTLGFEASYLYEDWDGNVGSLIKYSIREVRFSIANVFYSLKLIFTGSVSVRDMSGPVGIVDVIGDAVDTGMETGGVSLAVQNILMLFVLLNANLGIMNLLPLPALDGGRLFFILIELVRGKPVPPEKEGMVHTVGIVLLFMLMGVILLSDILKLFGR